MGIEEISGIDTFAYNCEQLLQWLSSLFRLFNNHIAFASRAYRFAVCLWLRETSEIFVNNKKVNLRNIQK